MESTSIDLLHSVQLDLLVKFDQICNENGLTYFLDSGTALGAVRHSGFIPWDDDVDVAMPRADYNKLLELGERGLPDNLYLQTYKTDSAYMMPFAKIRLGDTFFPDKYVEKMKYQGIYIDVFPYDYVPNDPNKACRRIKISSYLYYFSVFSRRDYPGKKYFLKVFTSLLHRLSIKKVRKLHELYDRFCVKYNTKRTKVLTCFCWRMSQRHTYLFDESELFPTKRMLFEGKELSMMNNPHYYLTKMFGDYNTLPPEKNRKTHLTGSFII